MLSSSISGKTRGEILLDIFRGFSFGNLPWNPLVIFLGPIIPVPELAFWWGAGRIRSGVLGESLSSRGLHGMPEFLSPTVIHSISAPSMRVLPRTQGSKECVSRLLFHDIRVVGTQITYLILSTDEVVKLF